MKQHTMARKKKILTTLYDPVEYLKTEEDIANYIEAALEDGDPHIITTVLGNIARARGMMQIARKSGLARENLYKALSPEGNPEWSTIVKIMKALGLKLHVSPG